MIEISQNDEINRNEAPIGVFDSGVGGLTVVKEIMRQLPNERIIYFGDTARVPYGSKSKDTIVRYSRQIIRFLITKQVKAIVVACNTASAFALETVKKELTIPIIGVVKPGVNAALKASKSGNIGVIGTEGTIHSKIYSNLIHENCNKITVIGKACPLFVPLVEEGLLNDKVTDEMAGRYLKELKEANIDSLILGCTHYPLLYDTISKIMGDQVILVNPAYETAKELESLLVKEGLIKTTPKNKINIMDEFYVSDSASKFYKFARQILSNEIDKPHHINIEEY